MDAAFVLCPLCGGKTRLKLLPETVLKKYPLFCPKCKKEVIISVELIEKDIAETETILTSYHR